MESHLVGQWWLPSRPQRRVGGALDIDTSRALQLELTDALVDDHLAAGPVPVANVVWGASNGRRVTLLDCWPTAGSLISCGQEHTQTQVLQVQVVLVGIHLDSRSDAVFHAGEATMSGLTAWSGATGIRVINPFIRGADRAPGLEFNRMSPLSARVDQPQPWTISLHWRQPINVQPDIDAHARTYSVRETAVLRVTSESAQRWDGFREPWMAMRDLVTVATQHPSVITSRTLFMSPDDPTSVEVYYTSTTDKQATARTFDQDDVIFTAAQRDFGDLVPKWFALRGLLGLSLALLLGVDYHRRGYYENQLFDVAAAAEGFHSTLCPNSTDLPVADHAGLKEFVREAVRGVSDDECSVVMDALTNVDEHLQDKVRQALAGLPSLKHRQWILSKIGFNRPGLKNRYVELAQTKADSYAVALLLTDIDTWAKWLRTARNAVGHVSGAELERIPEDARYQLLYVTRGLLHLVLLNELGMSADAQQRLADDSAAWGHRARQFRRAVEEHRDMGRHR